MVTPSPQSAALALSSFATLSTAELEHCWRTATRPDLNQIAGWGYSGISLNLPALIDRLLWKKFFKEFAYGPGGYAGNNVRAQDNALDQAWQAKVRQGAPIRFGPFTIIETPSDVVLNYQGNARPLKWLRDPLRSMSADGSLLIGRSWLSIYGHDFATPSYFVLARTYRL